MTVLFQFSAFCSTLPKQLRLIINTLPKKTGNTPNQLEQNGTKHIRFTFRAKKPARLQQNATKQKNTHASNHPYLKNIKKNHQKRRYIRFSFSFLLHFR